MNQTYSKNKFSNVSHLLQLHYKAVSKHSKKKMYCSFSHKAGSYLPYISHCIFFFQEKKKTYFHIMNKKKGMQYYIQIQHTNLRKSRNWNYPWKKTKLPNPWHTRKQNEISMIFLVIRFRFLEPNGTIIFPLCLPSLSANPEYCSAFACIFHTISYQQEGYNSTHLATISFFCFPPEPSICALTAIALCSVVKERYCPGTPPMKAGALFLDKSPG